MQVLYYRECWIKLNSTRSDVDVSVCQSDTGACNSLVSCHYQLHHQQVVTWSEHEWRTFEDFAHNPSCRVLDASVLLAVRTHSAALPFLTVPDASAQWRETDLFDGSGEQFVDAQVHDGRHLDVFAAEVNGDLLALWNCDVMCDLTCRPSTYMTLYEYMYT